MNVMLFCEWDLQIYDVLVVRNPNEVASLYSGKKHDKSMRATDRISIPYESRGIIVGIDKTLQGTPQLGKVPRGTKWGDSLGEMSDSGDNEPASLENSHPIEVILDSCNNSMNLKIRDLQYFDVEREAR